MSFLFRIFEKIRKFDSRTRALTFICLHFSGCQIQTKTNFSRNSKIDKRVIRSSEASSVRIVPSRSCKRPRIAEETPKLPIAGNSKPKEAAAPKEMEKAKAIPANPLLSLITDKKLKVDEELLKKYPVATCEKAYSSIADHVTHLFLYLGSESDVLAILKLFPRIIGLSLSYNTLKLKHLRGIELFPQTLEWLNLGDMTLTHTYRQKLFDRLKGSLTRCDYFPPKTLLDFLPLVNLTFVRLPIHAARHGLKELTQQKSKIEELEVFYMGEEDQCSPLDWKALEQARNVKKLRIWGLGGSWPQLQTSGPKFKNLETLSVQLIHRYYWCVQHLLKKMGPQLKHLIIEDETAGAEPFELYESMQHLKQLETLYSGLHMGEDEEQNIGLLGKMRSVKKLEYRVECPDVAIKIVEAMPQLEEYRNDFLGGSGEKAFEKQLEKFLKKKGRTIKFNGGEELLSFGEKRTMR